MVIIHCNRTKYTGKFEGGGSIERSLPSNSFNDSFMPWSRRSHSSSERDNTPCSRHVQRSLFPVISCRNCCAESLFFWKSSSKLWFDQCNRLKSSAFRKQINFLDSNKHRSIWFDGDFERTFFQWSCRLKWLSAHELKQENLMTLNSDEIENRPLRKKLNNFSNETRNTAIDNECIPSW